MIRCRLLVAAVGAGLTLAGTPALAAVDPGRVRASAGEARAMALLEQAAQAGRRLSWSGTQYAATWRGGRTWSDLVELRHDPLSGSVVTQDGVDKPAVAATPVLDPRMLRRLAAAYDVSVSGDGRCAGREASIIDARRTDGELAGRFWVDRETGVLLRREVFDEQGERVRSSAFLDWAVTPPAGAPAAVAVAARTGSERPAPQAVQRLLADGWYVPVRLPEGFRLFETRLADGVLHLAYTDGLSTLSLFAQSGRLGSAPLKGFSAETVRGRPVWVQRATPERVVWSGGGQVWTLVSDAPESAVEAAVAALPLDEALDGGLRSRLTRGLGRLGGMLNPFD